LSLAHIRAESRNFRGFLYPDVSRRMLLSPPKWGNEVGNGGIALSCPLHPDKLAAAMAQIGKLSAVEVAKAKGPSVLHDGGGLYLRVAPNRKGRRGAERLGAKSWVFRFQLDGKRRDMGLGPYPDISLAEARRRAAEHRNERRDGIDPLNAKAAQRQAQRLAVAKGRTFRACAAEFIEKNRAGWRNPKHRQQWQNTLATYAYPVLGD